MGDAYADGSETHAVRLAFYSMSLADEFRNDLIDAEYEASPY